jgi:hypothetical protein
MPICANCQTPYEEGQRFCKTCGGSLIKETPEPTVCPGCGTILTNQAFCHECGTPLDATPKPSRPEPSSKWERCQGFVDRLVKGSPAHILALVGGCLLVLIIIILGITWISGRGTISSSPEMTARGKATSSGQKPSGEVPTSGVLGPPFFSKPTDLAKLNPTTAKEGTIAGPDQQLSLKEEIEEVLFNLRKGQVEKDIIIYMSCFSPSYPNLEQKREDTLKNWREFEFLKMLFNIDEIQEVAADSHIALVTWDIQTRNINTLKETKSSQKYKVWFVKDAGKRLIKSLEKEGKEVKEVEHD